MCQNSPAAVLPHRETVQRPLCPTTAFTRATQGSPSLSTQGRQGLWVLPAPFGGRSVGRNVGCLGASRLQVHTSHQNNPPAPSPPPCTPMKKRGHRPTEREGYCSWHLMGSICCIPLGCCPGWIGKELAGRLSSVLTTWLGGSRGAWQGQSTGPGNWGLVHVCMHVCVCICMHMCVLGGGEEAEKPHPLLVAAVLLRASAARGCHYTSWQVSASKTAGLFSQLAQLEVGVPTVPCGFQSGTLLRDRLASAAPSPVTLLLGGSPGRTVGIAHRQVDMWQGHLGAFFLMPLEGGTLSALR